MLNKNNERELVYVARVEEIQPIEGYDRVEYARIGAGWWVVVRKEQFKPGDLAIYFEVDSKVPEKEPFMFLESKHFKIKTQRMCKRISQGLLMSFDDFGWDANDYEEGDFLTEKLGVTYSVAEDNKRKARSVDRYEKMYLRHKKLFKNKFLKWVYSKQWGKKILFIFLGKKKKNKNDWPEWVKKTDEERCFVGDTKVLTNHGLVRIGNIVNKNLDVKVLTYNEDTKKTEYKNIIGRQVFDQPNKMIELKYKNKHYSHRENTILCTSDHPFYTDRGYILASELTLKDKIYTDSLVYSDEAIQALLGMLAGDSNISVDRRPRHKNKPSVRFTQGFKQEDYLRYKLNLFGISNPTLTKIKSGYCDNIVYRGSLPTNTALNEFLINTCLINTKKVITQAWADQMTPISLAFLYMDDGRLRNRNKGKDINITISSCGFSEQENKLLIEVFNRYNIYPKLSYPKGKQKYFYIKLNTVESKKFLNLIRKYIPKSMKYKDYIEYENLECEYENKCLVANSIDSFSLNSIKEVKGKTTCKVYDITVEDNHNFFANGVLVHNCQNMPWLFPGNDEEWIATEKIDGSSCTFTVKGFGRKRVFKVCSRNVCFDTETPKKCYYDGLGEGNIYIEMANKYSAKEVMSNMLDHCKEMSQGDVEWLTIQGEVYGGNIQKRKYGDLHDLAVFNIIWGFKDGHTIRLNPIDGQRIATEHGFKYVPIVDTKFKLPKTCEELLSMSGGMSEVDGGMREGIVCRSYDGLKSFKAVDNEYLLKYHN